MSIKVIFVIFSSVSLGAAGIGGAFLYERLTKSDVNEEKQVSERGSDNELGYEASSGGLDGSLSDSSDSRRK